MLVVSAGMPKSGSAYAYNIINDLMIAGGKCDARGIKDKYKLESLLKWHNNNIGSLENRHLVKLAWLSILENDFVVKTHSGPTGSLKLLLRVGMLKLIYIYRDPRDVMISAMDHGKEIIAKGESHTFAQMIEFDKAMTNVVQWIGIWKQYSNLSRGLSIKYEDLLDKPFDVVMQMISYLGLDVHADQVRDILWKYNKENTLANMTGLHFNKAMTGRYKAELSGEQMRSLKEKLGGEILKMGYEI